VRLVARREGAILEPLAGQGAAAVAAALSLAD